MRILHTADWHLGDRLGRHDRTDDLRRPSSASPPTARRRSRRAARGRRPLQRAGRRRTRLRDAIRHLQEIFEASCATAARSSR